MRSARLILATAAASAALALAAPAAYAAGDWDHDDADSGYSKEHKTESRTESGHDAPRGGMHTGGGALTAVNADDWGTARDPKHDPETYKKDSEQQKDSSWTKDSEESNESWSGGGGGYEKPSGGVHTGGGALDTPAVTAGGLAVLALAGAGLYAARRKKSAAGLA
ncbi:hypothetical protein ACFWNK_23350 [Streptomyces sp. NPDC058417]|uniref:hypothetical protein n=1 Tax=unclassified Streptomyces TaxID=2593676 RepID=UPI003659EB39